MVGEKIRTKGTSMLIFNHMFRRFKKHLNSNCSNDKWRLDWYIMNLIRQWPFFCTSLLIEWSKLHLQEVSYSYKKGEEKKEEEEENHQIESNYALGMGLDFYKELVSFTSGWDPRSLSLWRKSSNGKRRWYIQKGTINPKVR